MHYTQQLFLAILATSLVSCSSGGGQGPGTNNELATEFRIINDFDSSESWACISESGGVSLHRLLGKNTVTGLEYDLPGMSVIDGESEAGLFLWKPLSSNSLSMNDSVNGTDTQWNNIAFSADSTLMMAVSDSQGQLYCSREQAGLTRSTDIYAEVPQVCIDRFQDGGATPGAQDCVVMAVTSSAGLNNYQCTGPGSDDLIVEYCGLPQYVEEDTPELPAECDLENPLPVYPGSVDFALGPQGAYVVVSALQNYNQVANGVNLTLSAQQAQETGDSGLFFSNLYALLLPLLPSNGILFDAFQSFSNFADTGNVINCP